MTEQPKTQVTVEDDDISPDILTSIVTKRESGIDSCDLIANDEKGKQYLATLRLGYRTVTKYKYEDGDNIWKTVFDGKVEKLSPDLSEQGEVVSVTAAGKGFPLKLMRVANEYGVQSWKPTLTTVRKILAGYGAASGLIGDYVEKIFAGAASGYSINRDYVYGYQDANLIPYILFPFESAYDCLQELIRFSSALRYKANPADWRGLHWIVDTDGNLLLAPVGNHNVYGKDANYLIETKWATYASATPIEVTKQMITQQFTEEEVEANYVVVAGKFIRPLNEAWTENPTPTDIWEKLVSGESSISWDTTNKVSGDGSVKFTNGIDVGLQFFRVKEKLGVDLTKLMTKAQSPTIAFWARRGGDAADHRIFLMKDTSNYFYYELSFSGDNIWTKFEIELPKADQDLGNWKKQGTLSWSEVEYIGIAYRFTGLQPADFWIDDLKVVGNVIRAAYDSTSIAAKGCRMLTIKDSLASTDTLDADDDDNPLAQFALAELLKAREPVLSGQVTIPLAPTFKAGQLQHMHGSRKEVGFNIDRDFRFTEVKHVFAPEGALTMLTLSSDLKNSIPRGGFDPYSIVLRAVNPDFQTKTFASIRTGGEFDIGLTILAKDYPS